MSRAPFQALLFWVIQQGNAIPTESLRARDTSSNHTQLYEPRWVAGPKTRGTLSLVFSCVITLFLCVWTTVHVNIEPPENEFNPTLARFIPIKALKTDSRLLKFLAKRSIRKLGWGCVTLIVPEGVMAIAAYERKIASLLRDKVNETIGKDSRRDKWDMPLGYYAIMGGFVIPRADYDDATKHRKGKVGSEGETGTASGKNSEITSKDKKVEIAVQSPEPASKLEGGAIETRVPEGSLENKPLTLTPYGVLKLAEWQKESESGSKPDLITITSAQVQDKSNANSLAKVLVAWQALWMIVQIIGRRAEDPGIPVTLLELHTCLHSFCAFAMYITWWDKPVDIDLPTTVHLSRDQIITLIEGEPNPNDPTNLWSETGDEEKTHSSPKLSTGDASRVFLTSRSGIGKLMYQRLVGHRDIRTEFFSAMSDAYIRLWRGKRAFWKQSLVISFVGLVFGGVHLAAWNSSFPSYAERVLWQISSTITATAWSGFVLSLWLSVFVQRRREGRVFSKACGILLGLGIFPVLLVRVYLLVESFASIRRLPLGSYRLNIWSNVWPHAG